MPGWGPAVPQGALGSALTRLGLPAEDHPAPGHSLPSVQDHSQPASFPACPHRYCPDCRIDASEVVRAGERLRQSKKKAKMASATSSSQRDWGKVRLQGCSSRPRPHTPPTAPLATPTPPAHHNMTTPTQKPRPPIPWPCPHRPPTATWLCPSKPRPPQALITPILALPRPCPRPRPLLPVRPALPEPSHAIPPVSTADRAWPVWGARRNAPSSPPTTMDPSQASPWAPCGASESRYLHAAGHVP